MSDVTNPTLGIYAVHTDGSRLEKILDLSAGDPVWGEGGQVTHFDVSPDSSRIVYSACAYTQVEKQTEDGYEQVYNYEIAVANIDGSDITRLTENAYFDNFPAWSPDGNSIAFISDENSRNRNPDSIAGQLTIHKLDTGKSRNVALPAGYAIPPLQAPVWSPDGQRIAFVVHEREDSPRAAIYTVRHDGSGLTRISTAASGPAWSPDGSRIAVVVPENEDEDGEYELNLYLFSADGSDHVMTGIAVSERYPWTENSSPWAGSLSWSPDGSVVLQQDIPIGGSMLNLDPADIDSASLPASSSTSMEPHRVHGWGRPVFCTPHPALPQFADWSPDGSRIATRWGRAGLEDFSGWHCGREPAGEIWVEVWHLDDMNPRTMMKSVPANGSGLVALLRIPEQ